MPGLTNNENLLAGLNQLIVAMNELTAATTAQEFDPNINVAAPNVTVEASPIPPAPNVTVNFDTATLATKLEAISGDLANIAVDTDGLGNLLQIAGNSDHLTHLQQFPNLISGMATANTHFSNIADRLAPDGESIQPTLLLLINALEAQLSAQSGNDFEDVVSKITLYNQPNAIKCLASKRAVGHTIEFFYDMKFVWGAGKIIAITEIAMAALLSGGLTLALGAIALQSMVDLVFSWGQSEMETHYSELLALAPELVCAVYSAVSPAQALASFTDIIENHTWTLTESPNLIKYILPIKPINKVFSAPETLEPEYYGGDELGDWTNFDCGECAQELVDCAQYIDELAVGTGTIFDGNGDLIFNQVIRLTSVDPPESGDRIELFFQNPVNVTIIAQTDGSVLSSHWKDCYNNYCLADPSMTNADLPLSSDTVHFYCDVKLGEPDVEFYLDIMFSQALPGLDCS